jgi:hypothetical protein
MHPRLHGITWQQTASCIVTAMRISHTCGIHYGVGSESWHFLNYGKINFAVCSVTVKRCFGYPQVLHIKVCHWLLKFQFCNISYDLWHKEITTINSSKNYFVGCRLPKVHTVLNWKKMKLRLRPSHWVKKYLSALTIWRYPQVLSWGNYR